MFFVSTFFIVKSIHVECSFVILHYLVNKTKNLYIKVCDDVDEYVKVWYCEKNKSC